MDAKWTDPHGAGAACVFGSWAGFLVLAIYAIGLIETIRLKLGYRAGSGSAKFSERYQTQQNAEKRPYTDTERAKSLKDMPADKPQAKRKRSVKIPLLPFQTAKAQAGKRVKVLDRRLRSSQPAGLSGHTQGLPRLSTGRSDAFTSLQDMQ